MLEVTSLDHASPATLLSGHRARPQHRAVLVEVFATVPAHHSSSGTAGLRPQGGVQEAGAAGGQAPPPLPRGANGRLHHPLHRQVPGSRKK